MKYKAVIETDDFEDFQFFEDGSGKYIRGIDAGAVNNEWIPLYFTECEQEPCEDRYIKEINHLRKYIIKLETQIVEQETSDDAVNRQAVHRQINKWVASGESDNSLMSLHNRIDTLLPVEPKSKVGRWIKYGVPRCGEQHYKCTSCGYYINFGQWGELYTKEFKYCPNCMARMTGGVEDND